MARRITQTLANLSSSPITTPLRLPQLSLPSGKLFSSKAQLIEVDLGTEGGEVEVLGLTRLEDAIHSIIVRRLAPDWLPFRPGSSYWVPPKRHAGNILELVGKLTNPLTEEESLSLSSARGWPCSSFFVEGVSEHPIPVEVEVQVHVQNSPKKTLSGDEE